MNIKVASKPKLVPLQQALGVIMQTGTIKVFCPNEGCRNAKGENSNWGVYVMDGMINPNQLQCRNCGCWIDTEWDGN